MGTVQLNVIIINLKVLNSLFISCILLLFILLKNG